MNVWGWLALYVVIVLLRNFADGIVWTHTIGHSIDPVHGQYFSIHKIFSAYALAHLTYALITCCMLYYFTRENILKITKIVIVFWLTSWVVPIT
ncbi:MAG: hypothetical protein GX817_07625, partial [Elusimicrobia bacterium]|nr:hypothetical protein [Elusimicrobiota bacterium]